MTDPDFEDQLRQEQLAKTSDEGTYRSYTDKDGTVFEWDPQKKAYFPKIDDDFIARYQMNYGQSSEQESSKEETADNDSKTEEEKRKEYEQYCKDYYNYYNTYYKEKDGENWEEQDKDGKSEGGGDNSTKGDNSAEGDNSAKGDNSAEGDNSAKGDNSTMGDNSAEGEYTYEDYCAYYNYYYGHQPQPSEGMEGEGKDGEQSKDEKEDEVESETDKEKAGEKRKSKEDPGWFDHDNEKSTHVYVSGLPLDVTDEEFCELMNKYGLIMFDPFTRKPKLKLYRDENGQPKGDGLCCFIKQESVDLVLNILDGSEVRGHKVSVERAQFQMKGQYNPPKKRKKLSNKDKRKIKEKQEK